MGQLAKAAYKTWKRKKRRVTYDAYTSLARIKKPSILWLVDSYSMPFWMCPLADILSYGQRCHLRFCEPKSDFAALVSLGFALSPTDSGVCPSSDSFLDRICRAGLMRDCARPSAGTVLATRKFRANYFAFLYARHPCLTNRMEITTPSSSNYVIAGLRNGLFGILVSSNGRPLPKLEIRPWRWTWL